MFSLILSPIPAKLLKNEAMVMIRVLLNAIPTEISQVRMVSQKGNGNALVFILTPANFYVNINCTRFSCTKLFVCTVLLHAFL